MEEVQGEKGNQWSPTSPSAASTADWDSLPDVATPVVNPDEVREGKRDELENPSPLPAGAATMLRAKTLAQMAMDDLRDTPSRSSNVSHVQRLREECQAARSRIQQNVSSVSKVFEIIRSLESYLVNLEDCKTRVKQARNARWADLSVSQKRLELLSKLDWFEKPTSTERKSGKTGAKSEGSHVSRGNLVEALELEREALLVLRRELGSLLGEFDPIIEVAVDLRKRLQQEASERRAAMRKDHATLTQPEGSELSEQEDGARGTPSFDDGHFWAKKAKSLEDSAQQLLQRAISTVQWTDLECCQANHSVCQSLARCSAEDQRMRRQYDAQLRDVNFAMSCAEWTISKSEHRRQGGAQDAPQVKRASVLLHELNATKKQLKVLVRKCKRDLQVLENCRNTTPHTMVSVGNVCKKRVQEKPKDKVEAKDEVKAQASTLFRPAHVAAELATFELRHLQAEERRLGEKLQLYESRIERCATWASLLTDLEDHVAEALA